MQNSKKRERPNSGAAEKPSNELEEYTSWLLYLLEITVSAPLVAGLIWFLYGPIKDYYFAYLSPLESITFTLGRFTGVPYGLYFFPSCGNIGGEGWMYVAISHCIGAFAPIFILTVFLRRIFTMLFPAYRRKLPISGAELSAGILSIVFVQRMAVDFLTPISINQWFYLIFPEWIADILAR